MSFQIQLPPTHVKNTLRTVPTSNLCIFRYFRKEGEKTLYVRVNSVCYMTLSCLLQFFLTTVNFFGNFKSIINSEIQIPFRSTYITLHSAQQSTSREPSIQQTVWMCLVNMITVIPHIITLLSCNCHTITCLVLPPLFKVCILKRKKVTVEKIRFSLGLKAPSWGHHNLAES